MHTGEALVLQAALGDVNSLGRGEGVDHFGHFRVRREVDVRVDFGDCADDAAFGGFFFELAGHDCVAEKVEDVLFLEVGFTGLSAGEVLCEDPDDGLHVRVGDGLVFLEDVFVDFDGRLLEFVFIDFLADDFDEFVGDI